MTAGLYFHIPFCTIRCGYCDFFTVAHRESQVPIYLNAVKNEIEIYASNPEVQALEFATIYFGGGTPSLLTANQIHSLITSAFKKFKFSRDLEITLETNPGTVTVQKLRDFHTAGVNRLSIGLQSFHKNELEFLDRDHSADDSVVCFKNARKAGFDNISIDLIFGLPEQKPDDWQHNLKRAVELEPEHISTYNLTYEEGTPLTNQLQKGVFKICPEENQRNMLLSTIDFLKSKTYFHYEISNYSRRGFESNHNQKYWDGSSYLGLGVSAHSKLNKKRFWNIRNFSAYVEKLSQNKLAVDREEILGPEKESFERIFLGLRQRKGVDLQSFQSSVGASFFQKYSNPLQKFFGDDLEDDNLKNGLTDGSQKLSSRLLKFEDGFLRLTNEGLLVYDAICVEFV